MSRTLGIVMWAVVVCGLFWQREAFAQGLSSPKENSAPSSPCADGWDRAFEHAQTVTVWIETYFANGTGVLLSRDIVAVPVGLAVRDYGSIQVRFHDDTTVAANVVHVDPISGLALLKLEQSAAVAPPSLADVASVPLLAPLLLVTQPRKGYADQKAKFARAAPTLATRGRLVDATTFTVSTAGAEVIGAPVVDCDARLHGVVVQNGLDGTLAANRRALLDAITAASTAPYAGSNAYSFKGSYSGFSIGPNPKFGVMLGFEVFYFRRFQMKVNGGYGFSRTKGGAFGEMTAGYRWAFPRAPIFMDLDVGGGVGNVDIDARGRMCVKETCLPVGTATRSFVSGRFSLTAGWFRMSLGLRVDPKRGDVGPVAFLGLGAPTELSDAYRNHE